MKKNVTTEMLLESFANLVKAEIEHYNLTCTEGYELTMDDVIEFIRLRNKVVDDTTLMVDVIMLPVDIALKNGKQIYSKGANNLKLPLTGAEARRLAHQGYSPKELYFVSNEEIKEGDWMTNGLSIFRAPEGNLIKTNKASGCKKVIATTDTYLNEGEGCDTLLIPDHFIKEYVKSQGKMTRVEIEADKVRHGERGGVDDKTWFTYTPKSESGFIKIKK
jgi:hypothetical protein